MKRFVLIALAAMLVLSLGGFAVPAGANHPGVSHSNMDLTFNSDDPFGDTNPDLAFWGDLAYVPNYRGLRIFDISTTPPTLLSTTPCDGPQNDVSVWDRDGNGEADILFLSVDTVMESDACGAARKSSQAGPFDGDDWEGIRVFDVSNPAAPVQIETLYQDCGSHTHTLLPDPDDNRVVLYNSSYSLRSGPTCGPGFAEAAGRSPVHGVIQVSEVTWNPAAPLNAAGVTATEIAEPEINYPGDTGNVFDPSHHSTVLVEPNFHKLRACHDIGVFMELLLAAAACAEQGQLWNIDPVTLLPDTDNPRWVFDNVADTDGAGGGDSATDFWHSGTFTWDGKTVNFMDESLGSGCPPVSPNTDPDAGPYQGMSDTGRTYFIDTSSGKELSQFMIPRADASSGSYCSSHLGLVVPQTGRDYLVSAWYTGGASVIDFTAKKKPKEVAFFDFNGPGASGSNNWTHYWYETSPTDNSFTTYGQDIGRGFEQFEVTLKTTKQFGLPFLNPQTQMETLP